MKKFDFDVVTDRRNSGSMKWNVSENELPMWVADMDFPTAPAVRREIERIAAFGVFGYKEVPDEWYSAICDWWKDRHGLFIDRSWLCFCTGVIPAITSMVKRLSEVGDNVALFTPVYDIFFHSVENTGRHVLECPLAFSGGRYFIDFNDLDRKLSLPTTSLLILCNPHNPIGKIWDIDTLKRIGDICAAHGVKVISDEIHCDLTAPGKGYIPFASASDVCKNISVTCISASKAFNLAGLQSAAVFAADPVIRNVVVRGLNSDEVAEPNAFACEGAIAAFTRGGEWLDSLREYLSENREILTDYVKKNIPDISVVDQDATYLVWADVSKITDDAEILCDSLRKTTGLFITPGGQYRGNGKTFIRINVACPKSVLFDGLKRLFSGVNAFRRATEKSAD